MIEKPDFQYGLYKHFKGSVYKATNLVCSTVDLKWYVVYYLWYKHITPNEPPTVQGDTIEWARPLSEWFEYIDRESYKGPRFVKMDNER